MIPSIHFVGRFSLQVDSALSLNFEPLAGLKFNCVVLCASMRYGPQCGEKHYYPRIGYGKTLKSWTKIAAQVPVRFQLPHIGCGQRGDCVPRQSS